MKTTERKVASFYHHTWRKYQAHISGLRELHGSQLVDDQEYSRLADQAFDTFQDRIEKEFSALVKTVCVVFLLLFLALQVTGHADMYRISRPRPISRTATVRTIARRSGRKEAA
jgi:hypothetical protein